MDPITVGIGLVAAAVPELLKLFGKNKQAEIAEHVIDVAKQVTGIANPDEAAEAIKKDPELAFKFKEMMLKQERELATLSLQRETLYVQDVQDARKYRDDKVFKLGVIILISFVVVMVASLIGLFKIVSGTVSINAELLAAVIGIFGAIIGYFASNAQQVVSYFFGSSAGSSQKSDNLTDAIKSFKK